MSKRPPTTATASDSFLLPLSGGEGAGGRGNPQLGLDDIIADVDAHLVDFPVRIRAWQKAAPLDQAFGKSPDKSPIYTLDVAGDRREYKEVTLACPAGWSVQDGRLVDQAGAPQHPHYAVAAGMIHIADVAAFPNVAATRAAQEIAK